MELNQYQEQAMATRMESCRNFSYMFLNLVGELGEFASKIAKAVRKGKATIDYDYLCTERGSDAMTPDEVTDLRKEAGDMLWQLAGLCDIMGWTLEDVALENLHKLASRQQRNLIDGDGDNR